MKTDLEIFAPFAKKGENTERIGGTNCVIYTRVSSKEQADGYSLETQKNEIEGFCEKRKLNIIGYFGGVYESAQTDERKEFTRMLNFVRKSKEKISYILILYTDRFSRSGANAIYIASELRKENIKIMAVSNPVDTGTAEGKLQQNMQFLFSEYDNDLRRARCGKGTKEMLLDGYWPSKVPIGYSQSYENKDQKITVNEKGLLIKKAFYWKAESISNTDIVKKLKSLGVKIEPKRLSEVFRNPFYCGILSHKMLNGELIEGKHEKLISKELFLKVNNINANRLSCKQAKVFKDVPLKHFTKCNVCGTPMVGYLVRKKSLWYYKCNKIGCKCNRNAERMNERFETFLGNFQIQERYIEPIMDEFMNLAVTSQEGNKENESVYKKQLNEVNQKIEKLQERFILEEIDKEVYDKFKAKYAEEKERITNEIEGLEINLSNLEKSISKYCKLLTNLPELWKLGGYYEKMEIQNLLFPDGVVYYREFDGYRTTKFNSPSLDLLRLSDNYTENKNGLSDIIIEKTACVPEIGVEPI
jgi:site-specific DNA recombinase